MTITFTEDITLFERTVSRILRSPFSGGTPRARTFLTLQGAQGRAGRPG